MQTIGLMETLDALRDELAAAVERAGDKAIEFPIDEVELEFQVGVTRTGEGRAGVRFWVAELGTVVSQGEQSMQKVTVTLGQPVDTEGRPIRVTRVQQTKP